MKIEVDKEKCNGCGICKESCPKGPKIWDVNNVAKAHNLRYCHLCTICASKCPQGAIIVLRDDFNGEKNNIKEKDL